MMPAGLIQAVDTLADRIVSKAAQLIRNKTTNLCENYMSIRCKMDGGKYFNRIQSGSFQYRCMAAALRVQCGPDWIAQVWRRLGFNIPALDVVDTHGNRRKRKHTLDSARKVLVKYKRQRLMSKLVPSNQDTSYGVAAAQVDVTIDELQVLCREYLPRLVVTEQQQQQLALRTTQQANDPSGEWGKQRKIRITASHFGEVCKRRAEFGPLTVRILYSSTRETPAMRYGCIKEGIARAAYTEYLKSKHHPDATVTMTGLHVDLKVTV